MESRKISPLTPFPSLSQAIFAGAVPVFFGAEDVGEFAPGERSVIRTADFASPKQLAEYLLYLDRNDTAYREYFSWKRQPLHEGWLRDKAQCAFFAQERLCDAALVLQQEERDRLAQTFEPPEKEETEKKRV